MSIFAGVYSLTDDCVVDESFISVIKKSVIIKPEDKIETYSNTRLILIKFDFNAFGSNGFLENKQNGVGAIAGEPFLNIPTNKSYSRKLDLIEIDNNLHEGNSEILKRCNGTYSICSYNSDKNILFLATDKLGVRPLYYYNDDQFLYFASSLKILENIDKIPKRRNFNAFIQSHVFGVPLGDKTQYLDIKVLRDGQYLKYQNYEKTISYYFRWDLLEQKKSTRDNLLKECFEIFRSAVACRCSNGKIVFSLLSGGLDSRCIVSILNSLDKEIVTFNSYLTGEQDQVFAKQYAKQLDINFLSIQRSKDIGTTDKMLAESILNGKAHLKNFKSPKTIFSGDGGSVGVGHVYMDNKIMGLLNQNKISNAMKYFLRDRSIPEKILKKNIKSKIANISYENMKEELEDIHNLDPGRKFFLFLLRNDQRRHLHQYYENIDSIRVELLLPFFDARLLELIVSSPVEDFLLHNFYHQWLYLFPKDVLAVPWQTYPGHLSCPVPNNSNYLSQWENKKNKHHKLLDGYKFFKLLFRKDFPMNIVNKVNILVAILLHSLNIRDYSYINKFCEELYLFYKE